MKTCQIIDSRWPTQDSEFVVNALLTNKRVGIEHGGDPFLVELMPLRMRDFT